MAATLLQIQATSLTIGTGGSAVAISAAHAYESLRVTVATQRPVRVLLGSGNFAHLYGPRAGRRSIEIRGSGITPPDLSGLTLTSAQTIAITRGDGSTLSITCRLELHSAAALEADLHAGTTSWVLYGDEEA